jgi:predicted amidophosphoribosyltransferase
MTQNYNRYAICLECGEDIHNSICPCCLFEETKQWFAESRNISPEKVLNISREIKKFIERDTALAKSINNHQECLICRDSSSYLCPYCFTEFLLKILKKNKVSREIMKEFFVFFNYDFEHTGYSKEAEKYIG